MVNPFQSPKSDDERTGSALASIKSAFQDWRLWKRIVRSPLLLGVAFVIGVLHLSLQAWCFMVGTYKEILILRIVGVIMGLPIGVFAELLDDALQLPDFVSISIVFLNSLCWGVIAVYLFLFAKRRA